MLIKKFFELLKRYISENQQLYIKTGIVPPFRFEESTIISFDVAFEIYLVHQQSISLQQLWEKEKDYSRLLKKENNEFQLKLNTFYSTLNDTNIDDIIEEDIYGIPSNDFYVEKKNQFSEGKESSSIDIENIDDPKDKGGTLH